MWQSYPGTNRPRCGWNFLAVARGSVAGDDVEHGACSVLPRWEVIEGIIVCRVEKYVRERHALEGRLGEHGGVVYEEDVLEILLTQQMLIYEKKRLR